MLKIGLTGGIASGKTRISNLFSQLKTPIIDTDIISREILEPSQPGYLAILNHFGNSIILDDEKIDRRKLRQIVFNDRTEKQWLESVLHPIIFKRAQQLIGRHNKANFVIVVIPLLFETNFNQLVDRVLVVDCDVNTQIERLLLRDKIDAALAQKMIDQQWSNQNRINHADDIICNNNGDDLDNQVMALHQKYLTLSNQ
ncbi:MAG: dephospho-CoA kinase [Gammaproteobacteria bacterium]|jgi:dephospho-CoA kinase